MFDIQSMRDLVIELRKDADEYGDMDKRELRDDISIAAGAIEAILEEFVGPTDEMLKARQIARQEAHIKRMRITPRELNASVVLDPTNLKHKKLMDIIRGGNNDENI